MNQIFTQHKRQTVRKFFTESRNLAKLAGPLIIGLLSQTGMGFTDTVMAGRLGTVELAAVAVGSILWLPVFLFFFGILTAIAPIVANQVGGNKNLAAGASFRQGLWLALALGLLSFPATLGIAEVMSLMGTVPEVASIAKDYLYAVAWGMPMLVIFLAPRFFSEALGHTQPVMYIGIMGLIVNGFADYALMFGVWGAPKLGAVGCGVATAIVMWLDLIAIAIYMFSHKLYQKYQPFSHWEWPKMSAITELVRLGIPISIGVMSEMGLFVMVSLWMSSLSATAAAAHQVAINYASVMFMIPLATGMAIVIRVGHKLGQQDPQGARYAALTGIALATAFMAVSAIIMVLFRSAIVGLYTDIVDVTALATTLLLFAAAFQLSDGINITIVHALRGFKDTTASMAGGIVAFWMIGIAAAYYLGFQLKMGPYGLWLGLIIGLSVSALLAGWRLHIIFQRQFSSETDGAKILKKQLATSNES